MKLCRIGIHSYNKWSKAVKGYDKLTQFSNCEDCNRIRWRSFYGDQVAADSVNEVLDSQVECQDNQPEDSLS